MDNEFINRFNKKDELAFRLVFDLLYGNLVRISYSYTKDYHYSEDIVLIAFNKVWRMSIEFDTYIDVKQYLIRVIINASVNHLRANKIRRNVIETKLEPPCESEWPDINEEESSKTANIIRVIKSLPKTYKADNEVILLDLQGKTDKEIAAILNIKYESVAHKRWRAIKKLKSLLNK